MARALVGRKSDCSADATRQVPAIAEDRQPVVRIRRLRRSRRSDRRADHHPRHVAISSKRAAGLIMSRVERAPNAVVGGRHHLPRCPRWPAFMLPTRIVLDTASRLGSSGWALPSTDLRKTRRQCNRRRARADGGVSWHQRKPRQAPSIIRIGRFARRIQAVVATRSLSADRRNRSSAFCGCLPIKRLSGPRVGGRRPRLQSPPLALCMLRSVQLWGSTGAAVRLVFSLVPRCHGL